MSVKLEKNTIYEIFRSCRLCGGGDGFKMPIIQSAIGFDISDNDLRHKIKECVKIEVQDDDRMPPLICEQCIDKINEFYKFQEVCQQVNKKTRQRLGLPMHTISAESTNSDDCILGDTEPVFITGKTTVLPKPGPKSKKSSAVKEKSVDHQKEKEELEKKLKEIQEGAEKRVEKMRKEEAKRISALQKEIDSLKNKLSAANKEAASARESLLCSRDSRDGRPMRSRATVALSPSPSPCSRSSSIASMTDSLVRETPKEKLRGGPRSILNKDATLVKKYEVNSDNEVLYTRGKRVREKDRATDTQNNKKPKLTIKLPSPPPPKPGPKSRKLITPPLTKPQSTAKPQSTVKPQPIEPQPEPEAEPKRVLKTRPETKKYACLICGARFRTGPALISHNNTHIPSTKQPRYTKPALAPAEAQDSAAVRKETRSHKRSSASISPARQEPAKPALAIEETSATKKSKDQTCSCPKCGRAYSNFHNMKRHEKKCKEANEAAPEVRIPAHIRRWLRPVSIRTARCDPLLARRRRVNIGHVKPTFGLDKSAVYPYFPYNRVPIKREPLSLNNMVSIRQEIQQEFYKEEDYVHWDSDISTDTEDEFCTETKRRKVQSLTALSLKTIFSKQCLGKVPKKLRKVKPDALFDSLFNESDFNIGIDSIIDKLDSTIDGDAPGSNSEYVKAVASGNVSLSHVQNTSKDANDEFGSDSLLDVQDKSVFEANFDALLKSDVNDVSQSSKNDEENTKIDDPKNEIEMRDLSRVNKELDDVNSESPSCLNDAASLNGGDTNDESVVKPYSELNYDDEESRYNNDTKNDQTDDLNSNFSTEATHGSVDAYNNDDDANSYSRLNENDDTSNNAKIDNRNYDNSQSTNVTEYDSFRQNGDYDKQTNVYANGNNVEEIDSNALLDELDAQIRESDKIGEKYELEKDVNNKVAGDLVKDGNVSGCDSISDTEFNFDL